MQAIQFNDQNGEPVTDREAIARILAREQGHGHGPLRCMSPFFGLYVAVGLVVAGTVLWKLAAVVLG